MTTDGPNNLPERIVPPADPVTVAIARCEPGVAPEVIATAIGAVRELKERADEASKWLDEALLAIVRANGPFTIGHVRYYAGVKTTIKCVSPVRTAAAILSLSGVDFDPSHDLKLLGECLSSGAFKHGACRDVLGPEWGEHFKETTADELKEGKPAKEKPAAKLQKVDTRFID